MSFSPFVLMQDLEAPIISPCPGNINTTTIAGAATAVAAWNVPVVFDKYGAVMTPALLDGPHTAQASAPVVGVTPVPPVVLPVRLLDDPPYTMTYRARDPYGNEAVCAFTILVRDTEAPSVSCQSVEVTLAAGAGTATIPLSAWAPTASDNNGRAVRLVEPSAGPLVQGGRGGVCYGSGRRLGQCGVLHHENPCD